MKYKKILKPILLATIIFLTGAGELRAQNNAAALAAADSSRFSINNNGGWQLYNSYVNLYKPDSVQLELIVQHANNINWTQEQYVGKIKYGPLQPNNGQSIPFNLLNDGYMLRIEANGKCYLRFVSGILPQANPFIIPLKVFYKLP
jgi:hypothetical protein